ncbi:efflux RND transporter periplasmic adaptor subunit [Corallincola platygyrae]|uniref:Efflux RND transporter periplasmic adaptor subunit n=1 Tax=Corallincola platygyrae TaxID=1193278 RepID=A0ABW4XQ65_9GAMM
MWLSLVMVLMVTACEEKMEAEKVSLPSVKPIPVEVITLKPRQLQGSLNLYGVLEPTSSVAISADFSAPVAEVLVKEGLRVSKGQPLLRFDMRKILLKRRQIQHRLEQAQSQRTHAELSLSRQRELIVSNTVSQQQLDNAQADFDSAQALVMTLESELQVVLQDLNNAELRSPAAGVIRTRLVEPGENAEAYAPLFELETDSNLRVSVFVGEKMLPLLRLGNNAIVDTVFGEASARITSIASNASSNTGNYEVRLLLDNADHRFKAGMSVSVAVQTVPQEGVLLLPESAVVADGGEHVIYTVKNEKAHRRAVQLGLGLNDNLVILSGAKSDDVVVVIGADRLTQGSPVQIEVDHAPQ